MPSTIEGESNDTCEESHKLEPKDAVSDTISLISQSTSPPLKFLIYIKQERKWTYMVGGFDYSLKEEESKITSIGITKSSLNGNETATDINESDSDDGMMKMS